MDFHGFSLWIEVLFIAAALAVALLIFFTSTSGDSLIIAVVVFVVSIFVYPAFKALDNIDRHTNLRATADLATQHIPNVTYVDTADGLVSLNPSGCPMKLTLDKGNYKHWHVWLSADKTSRRRPLTRAEIEQIAAICTSES